MKSTGVALFVYNRPWHTEQVLDGLKKNNISELFIFCDGPKSRKGDSKIREIYKLVESINWCRTIIYKRDKNYGLANSIIEGVNYVLSKKERIIVLEDDCVPSPDFISFMERCLDKYENSDKVMSVTGLNIVDIPKDYPYDIYFFYRNSSWGWGTWKSSWDKFDYEIKDYKNFIKDKKAQRKFNRGGEDLSNMLKKQMEGKIDSWSIKWTYAHYKNNGYCVYPIKTRIKNIGLDGSGVHCGVSDKYNVDIDTSCFYKAKELKLPDKIFIDPIICNKFQKLFCKSVFSKASQIIKRFFLT